MVLTSIWSSVKERGRKRRRGDENYKSIMKSKRENLEHKTKIAQYQNIYGYEYTIMLREAYLVKSTSVSAWPGFPLSNTRFRTPQSARWLIFSLIASFGLYLSYKGRKIYKWGKFTTNQPTNQPINKQNKNKTHKYYRFFVQNYFHDFDVDFLFTDAWVLENSVNL